MMMNRLILLKEYQLTWMIFVWQKNRHHLRRPHQCRTITGAKKHHSRHLDGLLVPQSVGIGSARQLRHLAKFVQCVAVVEKIQRIRNRKKIKAERTVRPFILCHHHLFVWLSVLLRNRGLRPKRRANNLLLANSLNNHG